MHRIDIGFTIWVNTVFTCIYTQHIWMQFHYNDIIMGAIASQITSLAIVYSTVYSDASSASLAFVRGIHRRPVNSPHKWPVTRQMFHLMTPSCVNDIHSYAEHKMSQTLPITLLIRFCSNTFGLKTDINWTYICNNVLLFPMANVTGTPLRWSFNTCFWRATRGQPTKRHCNDRHLQIIEYHYNRLSGCWTKQLFHGKSDCKPTFFIQNVWPRDSGTKLNQTT